VTIETEVMIAGAGPVGLTLGLALSRAGVPCLLAERNPTTSAHPKMDVTNTRSMELFRRLGVIDRLRAAAVPEDHNMDVVWVTGMSGFEVHRFHYPSVIEARERIRARNDGSQPREPNMRVSQVILEPLLTDIVSETDSAEIRFGWEVTGFEQDSGGVTTTVRDAASGRTETVRSRYLAGCDGAGSVVRRALGFEMSGSRRTRHRFTIHFRSTDTDVLQRWGVAWHYQSPVHGTMICQDDAEVWTLHAILPDETDFADADPMALLTAFLGTEIDCEILQSNGWDSHLLLADHYQSGRVFLAGDSAHQYVPTGGYGMNTGVCDAVDLAWKLAAMHAGWGGERLMEAYEPERRQIGLRNREAARTHAGTRLKVGEIWDVRMEDDNDEGARLRAEIGPQIGALGNAENEALGIEIGYRYEGSPIICEESGAAPPLDDLVYRPNTWPGARAPSVFLADDAAIHDLFGPGFTLVDFSGATGTPFTDAAAARGVPLKHLPVADPNARAIYERDLVLVRPDGHVAWRGDTVPDDPGTILDHARGAA